MTVIICDRCDHQIAVGDWPWCPHGPASSSVRGDEIDIVLENNGTPEPIRFRSRAVMKKHLDAHGMTSMVRHVPLPGTDKSPHTTDWSRGIDPYTLENARVLLTRRVGGSTPDSNAPLPIEVTVRTLDTGFVVRLERD